MYDAYFSRVGSLEKSQNIFLDGDYCLYTSLVEKHYPYISFLKVNGTVYSAQRSKILERHFETALSVKHCNNWEQSVVVICYFAFIVPYS